MIRRLVVLLLSLVCALPVSSQPVAPKRIAVRAGRLIDARGGPVVTNALILIEGDKISSVTAGGAAPAGVRTDRPFARHGFARAHRHPHPHPPAGRHHVGGLRRAAPETVDSLSRGPRRRAMRASPSTMASPPCATSRPRAPCTPTSTSRPRSSAVRCPARGCSWPPAPWPPPACTRSQRLLVGDRNSRTASSSSMAATTRASRCANRCRAEPTGSSTTPTAATTSPPMASSTVGSTSPTRRRRPLSRRRIDSAVAWPRTASAPMASPRRLRAGVDTIEHGDGLTDEMMDLMVARGVYWVPDRHGGGPRGPRTRRQLAENGGSGACGLRQGGEEGREDRFRDRRRRFRLDRPQPGARTQVLRRLRHDPDGRDPFGHCGRGRAPRVAGSPRHASRPASSPTSSRSRAIRSPTSESWRRCSS